MRWKVVLEAEMDDEVSVEGALAEIMMIARNLANHMADHPQRLRPIARNLANHPEVWPRDGGVDRWTFDSSKDADWKDGLPIKCTVQKVTA